jgi:hypothetical protein
MSKTYLELFADTLSEEERVAFILRFGSDIRKWPYTMTTRELVHVMLRGQAANVWGDSAADLCREVIRQAGDIAESEEW